MSIFGQSEHQSAGGHQTAAGEVIDTLANPQAFHFLTHLHQELQTVLAWARHERRAWHEAVSVDPLLPACLLASDYPAQAAWEERQKALAQAGEQMQAFDSAGLSLQ